MENHENLDIHSELEQIIQKTAYAPAGSVPLTPEAAAAPPMDPAMAGMPMDPAMMGGGMPPMDPAMAGMPMDPAMMMGGAPLPMDPAMMGMDPAMAGGMPPMDPAAMGMPPVEEQPTGDDMISVKIDDIRQLMDTAMKGAKMVSNLAANNGQGATDDKTNARLTAMEEQLAAISEVLGIPSLPVQPEEGPTGPATPEPVKEASEYGGFTDMVLELESVMASLADQ